MRASVQQCTYREQYHIVFLKFCQESRSYIKYYHQNNVQWKKLFGFTSSCKNAKLSGRIKIIFVNHTLVWINLVLYPAKICDNERVGAMKEWGQLGWGECPSYR